MKAGSWQTQVAVPRGRGAMGGGPLGLIGYFVLALGLAASLLYLPWYVFTRFPGDWFVALFLTIACFPPGLVILGSLRPRLDRWVPPGIPLEATKYPALFALAEEAAEAVGAEPGVELYLSGLGEVGIGDRRMGRARPAQTWITLGLPVLATVDEPSLRAILAHEFGHATATSRAATLKIRRRRTRVLLSLTDIMEIIQTWPGPPRAMLLLTVWPLALYARLFLGMSKSALLREEMAADAAATQVGDHAALGRSLQRSAGIEWLWEAYAGGPVQVAVDGGGRPPLAHGFRLFLETPTGRATHAQQLADELAQTKSSFLDTHPPLTARLEALGVEPEKAEIELGGSCLNLLGELDPLEKALWQRHVEDRAIQELPVVSWCDVPDRLAAQWRKEAAGVVSAFEGLQAEQLPAGEAALWKFGRRAARRLRAGRVNTRPYAVDTLAVNLGVLLLDRGAEMASALDSLGVVQLAGETLSPWEIVDELGTGALSAADWDARCRTLGIHGSPLGRRNPLPA